MDEEVEMEEVESEILPEDLAYFEGPCTCEHGPGEHGWDGCNVEGCECEGSWTE